MDAVRVEWERRCAMTSGAEVLAELAKTDPAEAEAVFWRKLAWEVLDAAGAGDVSRARAAVARAGIEQLGLAVRRPDWVGSLGG